MALSNFSFTALGRCCWCKVEIFLFFTLGSVDTGLLTVTLAAAAAVGVLGGVGGKYFG